MRLSILASLLIALPVSAPAQHSTPLWGSLEPGPHRVGYRQLFLRDITRPHIPTPGPVASPEEQPGRQVRVLLWYPAASGGAAMTYRDYIEALAQTLEYRRPSSETRRATADAFVVRSAAFGGDSAAVRAKLSALAATPVAARLGARPSTGKFPLVLFPEWPASNSIMAEYLASHGFVVASPPMHGSYDADLEYFAVRGIESLVADFAFVLAALDTISFVDVRNTAAMGLGIGATGALAFQMRAPVVRAVVSLEGGITTEGEQRLIMRTPLFDVGRVRAPMLAITAPHPAVDPARLQLYRYAPQHLVHFPGMGEFWFLDYGILEKIIPGIIGPAPGNTALGFEWAARWVRNFLAANLRADTAAGKWLAAPRGAPADVFRLTFRPALPHPPSVAALKRMIESGGVSAVADAVSARAASDSQPVPSEYFVNLDAWLAEGRDSGGDKRRALAQLRVRLYPRSARAHAALASSALRMGDSATARRHFVESRRLLTDDLDPLLDPYARGSIEGAVRSLNLAPG